MDLFKPAVIIGVNFKDLQGSQPANQFLFAEVVLIDKTTEGLQPLLFQLKKEAVLGNNDLTTFNKDMISVQDDAFMMVGQVETIDKKKKLIRLSNGNTVSYNHLIVASGSKHNSLPADQCKEFVDGLQALIDGLRLKKIPNSMGVTSPYQTKPAKPQRVVAFDPVNSKQIQEIVSHRILKEGGQSFPLSLNGVDKRLYEVVI